MVLHHIYLGKGSLASSILTGTEGAVVGYCKNQACCHLSYLSFYFKHIKEWSCRHDLHDLRNQFFSLNAVRNTCALPRGDAVADFLLCRFLGQM